MQTFADIVVLPRSGTQGSQRYSVMCEGETLVAASKDPETDACRALAGRGVSGQLITMRNGKRSMTFDIARGATLRARDSNTIGPRFYKWAPFERDAA